MTEQKKRTSPKPSKHLKSVGLVLLGFFLGGLIFGLRTCTQKSTHQGPSNAASSENSEQSSWTCAMHPQIRQREPGQCPICGMDLIPVNDFHQEDSHDPSRITLSERAKALAKMRTTPVRRLEEATSELKLLGRIQPDETTLRTVTAWTGGRIDRLHVKETGQPIRAGQAVATLYSPEVFAAHQDLISAQSLVNRLAQTPSSASGSHNFSSSRQAATRALEAARERLRLLGVPDPVLVRMEKKKRPTRSVTLRTPFSGTVIERLATQGAYVSTGTPLYRIANLHTLWVELDVYEKDLPQLSLGQTALISVQALPGEQFEGEITFISPTINSVQRTTQARITLDNKEGRLRPGMFAEATVMTQPTTQASPLVIPSTAPLFTGQRSLVYVEVPHTQKPTYASRTVRLGPRLGYVYPVVAGLSEGERVVSKGAFVLDADLQIRGGKSMMMSEEEFSTEEPKSHITISPSQRKKLALVVSAYLSVQTALSKDQLTQATRSANKMTAALQDVRFKPSEEGHADWTKLAATLRSHAKHIALASDLESARQGFEPLSEAIIELLTQYGNPLGHPLKLAFCPMASASKGALWVQKSEEIENAYFGKSMRTCGEVQNEVAPKAYLMPPRPHGSQTKRVPAQKGHTH